MVLVIYNEDDYSIFNKMQLHSFVHKTITVHASKKQKTTTLCAEYSLQLQT